MSAGERVRDVVDFTASESKQDLAPRVPTGLAKGIAPSIILLILVLAGLPFAVWVDMRSLSESTLRLQAETLRSMIDKIRDYYASNVVARVTANYGAAHVAANYADVSGGIPIPATLSLELGGILSHGDDNIRFRFFSDYPFKNRAAHSFGDFERQALETLRLDPRKTVSEA